MAIRCWACAASGSNPNRLFSEGGVLASADQAWRSTSISFRVAALHVQQARRGGAAIAPRLHVVAVDAVGDDQHYGGWAGQCHLGRQCLRALQQLGAALVLVVPLGLQGR